ncbi:helix-turn-helix transcriptional regulator [Streptomyces sp. NPDC014733]|uniref:helix-turn-helix domain-containing protein n=1 Tax=Streptomyces sp. NPDC014733 TaxID=3364885 RepID=UPI0036F68A2C
MADTPMTPAHYIGGELIRRREERGWAQKNLARQAGMSPSRVAQIERAHVPGTLENFQKIDLAFGDPAPGFFERYWRFMEEAPLIRNWFARYVQFEKIAVSISEYAASVVPGLLQTEDYARALLHVGTLTPDEAETVLAGRLARQEVLTRAEDPPPAWFVIDEAVLSRPVGGPAVMAAQLGHILDMAARPNVFVQVVPVSVGAHPALGGLLAVLALPEGPSVAYLEGSALGHLVEESARVARYGLIYDRVQTMALSPEESASTIRRAMEGYAS